MKQYVFFLCGLLVLPFFVHAQTPQSQIEALLAQVQYLQSLLGAIESTNTAPNVTPVVPTTAPISVQTSTSAPCVSVSRDLRAGSTGADVTSLQTFLAADTSVYPEALITGYYGTLTVRAVERFQIKYGVVSSGTPATTGFGAVGPKTRAALAAACGKSSNVAIARDLVVSPRIGQVPLLVSATFSLNGSSCSSFSLDWGDGTPPVTFDAGFGTACTKDIAHKEAKHTYQQAGAYTLVLKAGQGSLAQASEVARVPVYVGVPVPASFSLSPNRGNAPLTSSVTFPVSGSTCTSFELDWGDGTIDRLEAASVTNCSADVGTEARSHIYTSPGSYNVTLKTGHGPISGLQVNERWSVFVDEPIGGAALSFLSTSGTAPFTANLALTAGDATCASYMVDWGDGTAVQQFDGSTTASCTPGPKVFTHTYIAPGTYNVKTKVGEGSLNGLPINVQSIVVRQATTTQAGPSCSDTRPVCGELGSGSCTAGYVCTPIRKNYANICALQAEGAYVINYGSCQ